MLKLLNRKNSGKKSLPAGRQGFTLIELLVVIAIIGILASIVLASLNTARKKSRDARRVADLNQIRLAQEMYFDSANGTYASTGAMLAAGCGDSCIAQYPVPPTGTTEVTYPICVVVSGTSNSSYAVHALLELAGDKPASAITAMPVGCAPAVACGGVTDYCVAP